MRCLIMIPKDDKKQYNTANIELPHFPHLGEKFLFWDANKQYTITEYSNYYSAALKNPIHTQITLAEVSAS